MSCRWTCWSKTSPAWSGSSSGGTGETALTGWTSNLDTVTKGLPQVTTGLPQLTQLPQLPSVTTVLLLPTHCFVWLEGVQCQSWSKSGQCCSWSGSPSSLLTRTELQTASSPAPSFLSEKHHQSRSRRPTGLTFVPGQQVVQETALTNTANNQEDGDGHRGGRPGDQHHLVPGVQREHGRHVAVLILSLSLHGLPRVRVSCFYSLI